jgi:hypothetical protein
MIFTIHGGRQTILSEVTEIPLQSRIDNAVIKALAKAHRWRRMIENGDYASITELAKMEKVNQSYACRLLRLTLLAPTVVTDILNGRHGSDLMLKRVMKPFSIQWEEQLAAFKMSNAA